MDKLVFRLAELVGRCPHLSHEEKSELQALVAASQKKPATKKTVKVVAPKTSEK